jgi:hypothetical protein
LLERLDVGGLFDASGVGIARRGHCGFGRPKRLLLLQPLLLLLP